MHSSFITFGLNRFKINYEIKSCKLSTSSNNHLSIFITGNFLAGNPSCHPFSSSFHFKVRREKDFLEFYNHCINPICMKSFRSNNQKEDLRSVVKSKSTSLWNLVCIDFWSTTWTFNINHYTLYIGFIGLDCRLNWIPTELNTNTKIF